MDGSRRTFCNAFLAELALVEVDVSHVVFNCDCTERTNLGTFATADAGCLAGLAGNSALVLVDTAYEDSHVPPALVAKLDNSLRTSLCTCSAGSTLLLINDRKSCCRIH